ncbi:MAG: tetratricopeptide repeat protein [Spirochaetes bacterium]|nr:tetratricopeptide repeat protein [Spirochaetota bacterium]
MKKLLYLCMILIVFITTLAAFATDTSSYGNSIMAISSDMTYIVYLSSSSNSAGAGEAYYYVYDMKNNVKIQEFFIDAGSENEDPKIARKAQEGEKSAELFFRKYDISNENFEKYFKQIKIDDNNNARIPGLGFVFSYEQLYGDKFYYTLYNENQDEYLFLFSIDHQQRNMDLSYKEYTTFKDKMEGQVKNNINNFLFHPADPSLIMFNYNYTLYHPMGGDDFYNSMYFFINDLKSDGDYVWLNMIGYKYYKQKKYDKAITKFKESISKKPDHFMAIYNTACTYSLLNNEELSLEYLNILYKYWIDEKNKESMGYLKKITKDKDFNNIRKNEKFIELVNLIK